MPIDQRWAELKPADWDAFAQAWIMELRNAEPNAESEVGSSVVMMNFTATPDQQWQFILAAVAHASNEELGHIAAGPIEHLLGNHGADYIDAVEQRAASDPKFARMLSGVWKYTMSDEVWKRIESLKTRFAED
jgi:hypothetical protein